MYLYMFYVVLWVLSFIAIIPVLIVGVIYIFMSDKPSQTKEFTIKVMLDIIKGVKTQEAFNAAMQQFKGKYKVFNDQKNIDTWINCIQQLASSSFIDTDSVARFRQELEDANPDSAKKISVAVGTALKNRENK